MGRFISDALFHFVGRSRPTDHEANYEVLTKILRRGCISHAPHLDNWGATSYKIDLSRPLFSEAMIVPTVTCYCDIPFEHLPLHLRKYGQFGLSLNRHLLTRYGARPVIYVPLRSDDWGSAHGGHTWLRDVDAAYRGFRKFIYDNVGGAAVGSRDLGVLPTSDAEASAALDRALTLNFLAFLKPYDSSLPETDVNYFYSEREWRKFGSLKFTSQDVEQVVVAEGYMDRMRKELPAYEGRVVAAPRDR